MLRIIVVALSLLFPLSVIADQNTVISSLKNKSVSEFDLGLFKINLLLSIKEDEYKGDDIGDTRFVYFSMKVSEDKDGILFMVEGFGRSKYVTEAQCLSVKSVVSSEEKIKKLLALGWPTLGKGDYDELMSRVKVLVKLIAEENRNFTFDC